MKGQETPPIGERTLSLIDLNALNMDFALHPGNISIGEDEVVDELFRKFGDRSKEHSITVREDLIDRLVDGTLDVDQSELVLQTRFQLADRLLSNISDIKEMHKRLKYFVTEIEFALPIKFDEDE